MMPSQLKETTMDKKTRTLLRVVMVEDEAEKTADSVERLMGNKPEGVPFPVHPGECGIR